MLGITKQLLDFLQHERPSTALVESYVHVILKKGTLVDANVLFDFFLEKPNDYYRASILDLLFKFGTTKHAERLIATCFEAKKLKEGCPENILHLLGFLEIQSCRDTLLWHAFEANDFYINQSAVLGLLYLDCEDCQALILKEIEACYNKNWFNEFVPALVVKLEPDKQAVVLQKLYEYGCTIMSTDSNAGVMFAFSLCGELGKTYFLKALWDEHWECYGGGTGTDFWTFVGLENLGIGLIDLYQIIKETRDETLLRHQIRIFKAMLDCKISRGVEVLSTLQFTEAPKETFLDIYKAIFVWENPNLANNIMDVAKKVGLEEGWYELEKLLLACIEKEINDQAI